MRADEVVSDIVDVLRTEVQSLAMVMPCNEPAVSDIEKMPLRLPAAYVTHKSSKYELVGLETVEVKSELVVYLATRLPPKGSNYSDMAVLIEEVRGALLGMRFRPGMEGLGHIEASMVPGKGSLLIHSLSFGTVFEENIGYIETGRDAIKTAHINILEDSTVAFLLGDEDPDYPMYRLFDRNISRPFVSAAAETLELLIDQGAEGSPTGVDTLIIPPGHNLDGVTMGLRHSADGVDYTEATEEWVATSGFISKMWTSVQSRFWKLTINSPSLPPSIPELFLTRAYEWEREPLPALSSSATDSNVVSRGTSDGRQRFLKSGPERRRRTYNVSHCNRTMRDEMHALRDTWAEGKPVWLSDHEGQWIYGGLQDNLGLEETAAGYCSLVFDYMEVLS